MKNKTIASWLAFLGGPLGLHRFYLHGINDSLGWLLPIPTALGLYGIERLNQNGLDDFWGWILSPMLGLIIAGCALTAIVYGLTSTEKWNTRFNPSASPDAASGSTNWLTVGGIALSLLVGTTVLLTSIVFSFQRYFENQIETSQSSAELSPATKKVAD